MFNKIKILSVAFVLFFSNVAFSATSAYSFVVESNLINKENKIDIVKQYRGIVNMPKVFCDVCVELTEEIITISNKDKNNSNMNKECEYDNNDVAGNIKALQVNNRQINIFYNSEEINCLFRYKPDKLLYYDGDNILYYITAYIGLLRANDVANNTILIKNVCSKALFVV